MTQCHEMEPRVRLLWLVAAATAAALAISWLLHWLFSLIG